MSIDFSCAVCKHMVRVAEGSEGRRTRCPKCQAILIVPGGTQSDSGFSGSASSSSDPFGSGADFRDRPESSGNENNPYASPANVGYGSTSYGTHDASRGRALAKEKLNVPVIGNIVVTSVVMVLIVIGMIAQSVQFAVGDIRDFEFLINFCVQCFYFLLHAFCIYALWQTKDLQSRTLAWVALTICVFPCTSSCCLISMPLGIWGMVLMSDDSVNREFLS